MGEPWYLRHEDYVENARRIRDRIGDINDFFYTELSEVEGTRAFETAAVTMEQLFDAGDDFVTSALEVLEPSELTQYAEDLNVLVRRLSSQLTELGTSENAPVDGLVSHVNSLAAEIESLF